MNVADFTIEELENAVSYSEIAGGEVYRRQYSDQVPTRADADVTVSTADELIDEAESAGRNEVVWIDGGEDTQIDLTDRDISGVNCTIAGNRGADGSAGPLVYTESKGTQSSAYLGGDAHGQIELHDTGRLTGFRLRGGVHDNWDNPSHPGYVPYRPEEGYGHYFSRAVSTYGDDIEVDNMEIFGWGAHGVAVGDDGYKPVIHNCYLHDTMLTSSGYGVRVSEGRPHVYRNLFNAHRHAIAGEGWKNSSFIVEENVFGPSTSSHEVDMHGVHNNNSSGSGATAGRDLIVRRNTFVATHVIEDANFDEGLPTWSISVRGEPQGDGIMITKNHFPHDEITHNGSGNGIRDWDHGGAFNQQVSGSGFDLDTGDDGFSHQFHHEDNRFNLGDTGYIEGYGAPINLNDPSTPNLPPGGGSEDGRDRDRGPDREKLQAVRGPLRGVQSSLGEVHEIVGSRSESS